MTYFVINKFNMFSTGYGLVYYKAYYVLLNIYKALSSIVT